MKIDFTCDQCGNHVQVILPPVDFHDLTPVEAWCHNRHRRTRMDRTDAPQP